MLEVRALLRRWRRDWRTLAIIGVVVSLGLGANLALVDTVDQLVFRAPAAVRDPQRLVRFGQTLSRNGLEFNESGTLSFAALVALQSLAEGGPLSGVAGYVRHFVWVDNAGHRVRLVANVVSAEYFAVLGTRPHLGDLFAPAGRAAESSTAPGEESVVISYAMWREWFGGARDAIGRGLMLGSDRFVVVGVAPPSFGGADRDRTDLWLLLSDRSTRSISPDWATNWSSSFLRVFGRQRAGVPLDQVRHRATLALQAAYPRQGDGMRIICSLRPLFGGSEGASQGSGSDARTIRAVRLLTVVSFLLLFGLYAGVGLILLERAHERTTELAMRAGLGATWGRLISIRLMDIIVPLAVGAVGAWLLTLCIRAWVRPALLPEVAWRSDPLDARLVGIAFGLLIVAMAASALPTFAVARTDTSLAARLVSSTVTVRRAWPHTALLIAQTAISVVLLVGALAFVRTLTHVRSLGLGFRADGLVLADLTAEAESDEAPRPSIHELDELVSRLRRISAAANAAVGSAIPMRRSYATYVRVPGEAPASALPTGGPYIDAVDERFGDVLGLTLVEGRWFTREERVRGAPVVVVNETARSQLWRRSSVVGRCLYVARDPRCYVVTGVVRDYRREMLSEGATIQLLVPLGSEPAFVAGRAIFVRLQTMRGGASTSERSAVEATLEHWGDRPARPRGVELEDVNALVDPELRGWQIASSVFGCFAALALCIAAAGIFGVLGLRVGQREREIGIRLALGASTRAIVLALVARTAAELAVGLLVGCTLTVIAWRGQWGMLTSLPARDGATMLGTSSLVIAAFAVMALVPHLKMVRRAPASLLRQL